jgi:hypothetical protein
MVHVFVDGLLSVVFVVIQSAVRCYEQLRIMIFPDDAGREGI